MLHIRKCITRIHECVRGHASLRQTWSKESTYHSVKVVTTRTAASHVTKAPPVVIHAVEEAHLLVLWTT